MNRPKTTYSKIVDFKKRHVKVRLVPHTLSNIIDPFFNNLHSLIVQTKDKSKDAIVQTKDISRDILIQTKDMSRDILIQTKDKSRDVIIQTKDMSRDAIIQTKDKSKDILDQTRDMAVQEDESFKPSPLAVFRNKIIFIFMFIKFLSLNVMLTKYNLTKERDIKAVEKFDKIICNSKFTKDRIKDIYGIDSQVIYPPIDEFYFSKSNPVSDNYWLSINRLVQHKRIEVQVEAFNKLPEENLIIVGGYDSHSNDYVNELYGNSSKNIIYLGFIPDHELKELLLNCKGFISTAEDEDFGMSVVEAMASGKPAIAPDEGGYRESIIDGRTGFLIKDMDPQKLIECIVRLSKELETEPDRYRQVCIDQAKKFSSSVFFKEMDDAINTLKKND